MPQSCVNHLPVIMKDLLAVANYNLSLAENTIGSFSEFLHYIFSIAVLQPVFPIIYKNTLVKQTLKHKYSLYLPISKNIHHPVELIDY